jgi:hypothetical protein
VAAIAAYKLDRGMTGPAEIDEALTAQLDKDIANKWRGRCRGARQRDRAGSGAETRPSSRTGGRGCGPRSSRSRPASARSISGVMDKFPDAKANYIDPVTGSFSVDVPGWLWFVAAAGGIAPRSGSAPASPTPRWSSSSRTGDCCDDDPCRHHRLPCLDVGMLLMIAVVAGGFLIGVRQQGYNAAHRQCVAAAKQREIEIKTRRQDRRAAGRGRSAQSGFG